MATRRYRAYAVSVGAGRWLGPRFGGYGPGVSIEGLSEAWITRKFWEAEDRRKAYGGSAVVVSLRVEETIEVEGSRD